MGPKILTKRAMRARARLDRLSTAQRASIDRGIDSIVCSMAWRETCQAALERGDVSFAIKNKRNRPVNVNAELARVGVYPPADPGKGRQSQPARPTRMKKCCFCGGGEKYFPPQYLHTGSGRAICEDCYVARRSPNHDRDLPVDDSSPSGHAIQALRQRGQRIIEAKMEPDDVDSLRVEISAYLASSGGEVSRATINFGGTGRRK